MNKNFKLLSAGLLSAGLSVSAFASQTLFINVDIFNGTDNKLHKGCNVLIDGNKIKEWCLKSAKQGKDVTVIDGAGKTLMPGLIDNHTHFNVVVPGGLKEWEAATWERIGALAAATANEMLMEGFTTARDMGGMATGMKQTIDEGLLDGPRIYPSGAYISQTAGHGDLVLKSQQLNIQSSNLIRLGISDIADGEDAVRAATRRNLARGASQIKIMVGGGISSEKGPLFAPQFTDKEIRVAVEEAATRDTYVATHVYQDKHIERALNLGVMSIEHGQFISEKTAKLLKKKGAFIAPFTTGFSEEVFKHPVYGKEGTPQNIKGKEFQRDSKNFASIMKKVQPKVVFSSDVVFLSGVNGRRQRDFEKWTFTETLGNFTALKGMTSVAGQLAAMTGRNNPYPEGKLGVIESGAYADILIVEGNPLEDIQAIGASPKYFDAPAREKGNHRIKLIMKDGRVYKNAL
jgi:imidazolonepropionase-like amidohydrolase